VTPDTALRLVFDTTPEFWMNFQTVWELAAKAKAKKEEIGQIRVMEPAAWGNVVMYRRCTPRLRDRRP
jgi:plasmid maintenance system antidote protein VapI